MKDGELADTFPLSISRVRSGLTSLRFFNKQIHQQKDQSFCMDFNALSD